MLWCVFSPPFIKKLWAISSEFVWGRKKTKPARNRDVKLMLLKSIIPIKLITTWQAFTPGFLHQLIKFKLIHFFSFYSMFIIILIEKFLEFFGVTGYIEKRLKKMLPKSYQSQWLGIQIPCKLIGPKTTFFPCIIGIKTTAVTSDRLWLLFLFIKEMLVFLSSTITGILFTLYWLNWLSRVCSSITPSKKLWSLWRY